MNVALIHYWLLTMRGGEKVLEQIAQLFPDADIFTHISDKHLTDEFFLGHDIHNSFISKLPLAKKYYQLYLPFMPLALEQLNLSKYDLIISSESGPAKGVLVRPDAMHICYCHSPMRYAWDMYLDYQGGSGFAKKVLMALLFHKLRIWDYASSARVDYFIANSAFVASRIEKFYRRDSEVIYPPVAVDDFLLSNDSPQDFYLLLGQLVSYKRADLAVKAFTEMGKRLIVVGEGPDRLRLEKIAGPSISFLGKQSFLKIRQLYAQCRALIFPGVEDFGIVPVEAMASGRPVIAMARGGALETVIDGKTGLFFKNQSVENLKAAVLEFEQGENYFDPNIIRRHAENFSEKIFKKKLTQFINKKL